MSAAEQTPPVTAEEPVETFVERVRREAHERLSVINAEQERMTDEIMRLRAQIDEYQAERNQIQAMLAPVEPTPVVTPPEPTPEPEPAPEPGPTPEPEPGPEPAADAEPAEDEIDVKVELKSRDLEGQPPEQKSPEPEPADGKTTTPRNRLGVAVISLEEVRDWVAKQTGPFSSTDAARALDVSPTTVKRHLNDLKSVGAVVQHGITGRAVRYEFVKPDPRMGPRERPRHDGPRDHNENGHGRGEQVPHVGRAKGRSGRPGRDRKMTELGFRVKSH